MADQVVEFLKNWYKVFPEYAHQDVGHSLISLTNFTLTINLSQQTVIGGESYAGQYIPYIGTFEIFESLSHFIANASTSLSS